MKKAVLLLLTIAMLFCIGCTVKAPAEEDASLPALIIGSGRFPPYYAPDANGEPAGIDVALATEACRRIGYRAVFLEIDWMEKDTYLQEGTVDCLWACFSMNDRETDYRWAGPYAYDRQVVAVSENAPIRTLGDLNGKRVCVQMNSRPEHMLLEHSDPTLPQAELVFSLYDINECVSALRREYADACIGHEAPLREALEKAGVSYRILDEPLFIAETGVAFARDDTRGICEQLDAALREMRADGTIGAILEQYGLEDREIKA